ncbi:MAG: polysulfide reductase NrfD [Propionibacterium sp.]|nr:polysulfide reductase NrfD [Propionibacterium sp.]
MSTACTEPTTDSRPPVTGWRRFTNEGRGHEPFLTPRNRKLWYGFLAICLIAGSWGAWLRLTQGLAMTDLTSQMPWGAWVAFYIFFVGLSAGAFLLSSLVYVFGMYQFERIGRAALLSAVVSMFVALAFIGLDLGRVERGPITLAYFHWTSPLSWEVRFYVIYIALLIAELIIAVRLHKGLVRSAHKAHRWLRILGTIGVPLAIIGVHGGTGTIFAVVKARAMWFGGLFPIIFVVSAMVSGTALLLAVYYWQRRGTGRTPDPALIQGLGKVLVAAVIIDLLLTFYEFIVPLLAFQSHDADIISIQATGPYAWTFWGLQLAVGMVIPTIILLSPLKRKVGWVVAAAMMVVVGIVGVRFNIVVPPLVAPIIDGYPTNYYFPTLGEWLLCLFLIAGGALLYSLISEWQPIHEPEPDTAADTPVADADSPTTTEVTT